MSALSPEQIAIVQAPLEPLSVTACAGSGKTRTAVYRLAEIRRRLKDDRGRVALLSFSNVAVDTFRSDYKKLLHNRSATVNDDRVEIDTFDGFITSNILRPHAFRTMNSQQTPFLVRGEEPFLQGYKFSTSTFPLSVTEMQVGCENSALHFYYSQQGEAKNLGYGIADNLVRRLGKTGAYTHNLGRYWCYRTLKEEPALLKVLSRRYPQILIDEAQDIGTLHQAILELMIEAGTQVSLIGDPCQAIYEFAGANGDFLAGYSNRLEVSEFQLTRNYRSELQIHQFANKLSGRTDGANQKESSENNCMYFSPYKNTDHGHLVATFEGAIHSMGHNAKNSAVLCRARDKADKLTNKPIAEGQGTVALFAKAAILRDQQQDYLAAFKLVVNAFIRLLLSPPQNLAAQITSSRTDGETAKPLRRLFWEFTRNSETGLPSAFLEAQTEWHSQLKARTIELLVKLEAMHGLFPAENLGNKLKKSKLSNRPLLGASDLPSDKNISLRVGTVHQAKGESLDAVLYVTTKLHLRALLNGASSELGRIGYVAATRAKHLFWLGVPQACINDFREELLALGFSEKALDKKIVSKSA